MIPILYKSDEVDFYDNGLGALPELYEADVQEQRNGLFTLTASYPVSGKRYKDIEVGRIILAKPNQNDDAQAFRIVNTELDIAGYSIKIEADHITYDLTHNMVKKVHLQGNGQNAMTHLQEATVVPHMFTFISDLQHEGDSTLQYVNPMEAIAGTEGSILQIWGGELKRDNRTVSMLSRRGRDNFTSFRLGKNINGLTYTVDMSNVVTRIIPTVTKSGDGDDYFIAGDYVDSKNLGNYPNIYLQHVDMGEQVTIEENETDDSIKAKIDAKAKNWFTQSANTGVDLPAVTVEIDVTSLRDSSNYQAEFRDLEAIELTDTVTVYVPEFGINVQAVVNELHFDPMTERVTSIVVGTSKTSFTDANANQFNALESQINKIRQDATTAIISSNGKNTNYYQTNEPSHPKEGDLWFKQVGDATYIMVFKDGEWVELVSTKTEEMIAKAVDDAIAKAQAYADDLNDKQAKEYQEFRTKYDKELADAKTERDDLDKQIQQIDTDTSAKLAEATEDRQRIEAKATKLVTDAEARADKLIGDNTTKITAVSQDIDGITEVVNDPDTGLKAVRDLASDGQTLAISATDKANKAQKDATTAITTAQGVQTQVTSNDGDIKDLQTQQTQTAKQVTTEIADRKTGDKNLEVSLKDLVSTQITSVTKEYTSLNEQTEQSFKSQIKNVTDQLNDMGQVNQFNNSEFTPDLEGWNVQADTGSRAPYRSYVSYGSHGIGFDTTNAPDSTFARLSQTVQLPSTRLSTDVMSLSWRVNTRKMAQYCHIWLIWQDANGASLNQNTMGNWNDTNLNQYNVMKWENISIPIDAKQVDVRFETREGTNAYFFQPMLVFGSTIGSYTAGVYNNNNLVESTRVQLTNLFKDQITDVKNDITTTSTQTTNQITKEVNDRKNGDSTLNTQLRDYVGTQVSSVTSGYKSAIEQSASAVLASVSTPNQLFNSDFSPDLEGWNVANNGANGKNYNFYRSYLYKGNTVVGVNVPADAGNDTTKWYSYFEQDVAVPGNNDSTVISMSWDVRTVTNTNYTSLWLIFKDANHNTIDTDLNVLKYWNGNTNVWTHRTFDNVAVPKEAKYVRISFQCREGTNAYLSKPMLTFTAKAQDYMPGSYSGMNTQTVLKLAKDNWALGIADNAGRIISGINGDTSGTVIQGKKLVINTDTTINGKAFIDASVIKNASISQAQMGNASVGSAQIINLDVAKLSGNIANFITANINTLNAKVLYGDTGHLGTTDTGRVINKQDNHLQLSAKGFYDSTNDRAQLELLGNNDSHISANMKGSLNYYGNPTDKGHGLGIRLKYNQILAIDEDGGSKMLYLSPYQGGEVRVTSRDLQAYYPMRASSFNAMSSRSAKSDIQPFTDCALDIVNNTKVRTYVKNDKQEIGVISDEADPRMLTEDENAVSLYDYTSILYKAVQELSDEVKELRNEGQNNQ